MNRHLASVSLPGNGESVRALIETSLWFRLLALSFAVAATSLAALVVGYGRALYTVPLIAGGGALAVLAWRTMSHRAPLQTPDRPAFAHPRVVDGATRQLAEDRC